LCFSTKTFCRTVTFYLLFITASLITIAGCEKQPTANRVADPADRVMRVRAEDWSEFTLNQAPATTGWVALPATETAAEYHSPVDPQALGLLSPQDCADCHADHVHGFFETAHARTCRVADQDTVLGPLSAPDNQVQTSRPQFQFETIEHQSQIVQRLHCREPGIPEQIDVPLAFAVGSGNHGQSYLAWFGDHLCQTPVSYLTEQNRWANSPGTYRDGTADFSRPVTSRCLDCHNTWVGHAPNSVNRFDKSHWILGVTCVRCHGAARNHVRYHRNLPEERQPQEIVNPRKLTRERANEICAQCHSGGGELRRPAFTYKPGEPLEKWVVLNLNADDPVNDDPHSANQLARLMRSACYQKSGTLTCMDCHNPHQQERGRTEVFSGRCQNCHQTADCGLAPKYADKLSQKCVECHMPSRRDAEVTSQGANGATMPLLRDHLIGIWPDVSRSIEKKLDSSSQ
jgi:hypothetical protein